MAVQIRRISGLSFTLLVAIINGCAGLDVSPIQDDKADECARGIRYYRSSPFLLIYTDNKGGLKTEVIYLPDLTKKMSIKPYNYLASNKTTLMFDKGLLTQAKAEVDETVVPAAVVASLETIGKELVKVFARGAPPLEVPAPYLFRIVKKSDGKWALNGGPGDAPIRVPSPPPPSESQS